MSKYGKRNDGTNALRQTCEEQYIEMALHVKGGILGFCHYTKRAGFHKGVLIKT